MVCSRLQNSLVKSRADNSPGNVERKSDKFRPFKGVTFYKRTGRWEANLWYKNKQHYLGAAYSALEAARAYDKAILFTRSSTDQLNFDRSDYAEDLEKMKGMCFLDYRQQLRDTSREPNCQIVNKSYKGILIDQNGKWEVKYWSKSGENSKPKSVLVGWYDTEETALRAYNEVASHYDGPRAKIKSFHRKRSEITGSGARSVRRATSGHSAAGKKIPISKEVVSTSLTRGDEPGIADTRSDPECNLADTPMRLEPLELPQALMESTYDWILGTDSGDHGPKNRGVEMVLIPTNTSGAKANEVGFYEADVVFCNWYVVKPVASCEHLSPFTYGDIISISTASVKDLRHLKMIPPFDLRLSLSI